MNNSKKTRKGSHNQKSQSTLLRLSQLQRSVLGFLLVFKGLQFTDHKKHEKKEIHCHGEIPLLFYYKKVKLRVKRRVRD